MKLSAQKLNIRLPEPLSISFHTFYYTESILVTLSHKGISGIGEAAPFKPITGDSQEEVIKQIKQLADISLNPEKDSLEQLHAYMDSKNIVSETLRAGMDFAYHDLLGKMKGIPVYQLYEPQKTLVNNSITIMLQETAEETAQYAETVFQKFPDLQILKMKLKGNESDIERVSAVKKKAPFHMKYILDVNQGFKNPEKDIHILNEMGKILKHIILVEQPTPKEDLEKLRYMSEHVKGMLIFADESATTYEEVKKVIHAKAAHGINIKLQKAGGIWPAKKIAKLCKKNNVKMMLGCMLEGPIGIGAGIHFAVSTPLMLTDLDADFQIYGYTDTVLPFKHGKRDVVDKTGLGVELDMQKINLMQKKEELIYEQVI